MTAAIVTERLTKSYGKNRGVVDLDLEIAAGDVFGFLGPNGAGKTTTIRVLLDLIRPTAGRATVLGLDSRRDSLAVRRRVGFLPGELSLYGHLTGEETLRYFANLRGGVDWPYVHSLVERLDFDLTKKVSRPLDRQQAQAGAHPSLHAPARAAHPRRADRRPRPAGAARVPPLHPGGPRQGQTVFLSSHVLPEVQRVCDRVGFIREGELVAVEDVSSLTGRAVRELDVVFAQPVSPDVFAHVPGVTAVSGNGSGLHLTVTGPLDATVKKLAEFEVVTMTSREPDLEDVFFHFYSEERPCFVTLSSRGCATAGARSSVLGRRHGLHGDLASASSTRPCAKSAAERAEAHRQPARGVQEHVHRQGVSFTSPDGLHRRQDPLVHEPALLLVSSPSAWAATDRRRGGRGHTEPAASLPRHRAAACWPRRRPCSSSAIARSRWSTSSRGDRGDVEHMDLGIGADAAGHMSMALFSLASPPSP